MNNVAKVLDARPALKARTYARVRAIAMEQKERDLQLLNDVADLLAANGFPDDEIAGVIQFVQDTIRRQTQHAIEDALQLLDDEGLDGLRRRLEERKRP
jgi:hypothetical protein